MQANLRYIRNGSNPPRVPPLKRARFWLICLFFLLWACAIAGRLFWLQIVRHQEFVERAQKQQQRTFEVAPRRGVLYDRNLHELAMTVQVDSIYAVPTEIEDKPTAAHTLAAIVHTDPDDERTTAAEIAANPPLAVYGVKDVLDQQRASAVSENLRYVAAWNAAFLPSKDLTEGISATFAKRPPQFTGE